MSLTQVTTPSDPLLSGIPAYWELSSNNKILSTGSAAEHEWSSPTGLSDGDWVEIQWNGNSYRFDVVAGSPDDTGFELREFSNPSEMDDFLDDLAANYYINQDYTVVKVSDAGPFVWKLVARENGSEYTITVLNNSNWGAGTQTAGADDVYAPHFRCLAEVWADLTGSFERIALLDGGFDDSDETKIFLDKVFVDLFDISTPEIYFPAVAINEWIRPMPEMIIDYFVAAREFYGEPPTVKVPEEWGTEAEPKQAIELTLAKADQPGNTIVNDYFTVTSGRKMYIDLRGKTLLKNQTDYFYLYMPAGSTGDTMSSTVDLYFKDGTDDIGVVISTYTLAADADAQIWELALDWGRIKDKSYMVDQVKYFDFYVTTNFIGGFSTEKLRLYIDYHDYENEHYFMYKNLYGGFSTIGLTGPLTKKVAHTRQEGRITLSSSFDSESAEQFTYNHRYGYSYQLETGTFESWKLEQLNMLVASKEVYYLDGTFGVDGGQWRRVNISSKGLEQLATEREDLFERRLEFSNAVTEQ